MADNAAIEINPRVFLVLFFAYSVLSFFGFFLTSSGWTAFLFYGIGGLFFFLPNYIFLAVMILSRRLESVHVQRKWLIVLAIVQACALLFNVGDYGDNTGSRSFFEVLLGRSYSSCPSSGDCDRHPMLGDFAFQLALSALISYVITLVVIEFKIAGSSRDTKTSSGVVGIDLWAWFFVLYGAIHGFMSYHLRWRHEALYVLASILIVITGLSLLWRRKWARFMVLLVSGCGTVDVVGTYLHRSHFRILGLVKTGNPFEYLVLLGLSVGAFIYFLRSSVKDEFE